ncbi:porin family protein [Oceanibium sediminis]|uniref:porin family protein n=1 Tax=Oceanibium sediminis TaxID=2026339 RepID=UPI0013001F26|nr:porin family protein [Oceanibium sediminis]
MKCFPWPRLRAALKVAIVAAMLPPLSAIAQDAPRVLTPQQAVDAALAVGDGETALRITELAGGTATDITYVEGRILLAQGNYPAAIAKFREVLRANPEARGARYYLVLALAQSERYDTALFQLDRLAPSARNADERARLGTLRRRILSRRPYGLTFGFSLQPSTNINRATLNTEAPLFGGLTGTIDDTGESGISATVNVEAYRRFELPEGDSLTLSGGVGYSYFDNTDYNWTQLNAAATFVRPVEDGRFSLRVDGYRGLYRESDRDFSLIGLSAARDVLASNVRFRLNGRLSVQWYDDGGRARYNALKAQLDGSVRYPLTPRTALTGGLALTRTEVKDDRFSYVGIRPSIGLEHVWQSGWAGGLSVFAEMRDYDELFSLLLPVTREDRALGLDLTLRNERLVVRGFAPQLRCSFSRTNSNVVFYDNIDVDACTMSLTRQF